MASERDETRGSAETAQPDVTAPYAVIVDAVRQVLDVDAIANAAAEVVRAQVGMIPTAAEIARAIREYDRDHDVPASADRSEGHPTDPDDGLS